ncbi:MAG: hypothetical protein BWK78_09040 [Thiotrichaceae bacterium IS1]|nr:MAG: hypothetical protein BWK78_09040 [Thiotrichaceae bacterium IS1]
MSKGEVNNSGEGLFKTRKFKLIQENDTYKKDDKKNLALERKKEQDTVIGVARTFVANPNLIAVIGHRSSLAAIPASIAYQYHGVIFLAPTATNTMLTNHRFEHVLRLMPSNREIGQQLVEFCKDVGYKKMAVLYARNTYAEELSEAFISSTVVHATGTGEKEKIIEIVFVRSFFASKPATFSGMLAALKDAEQSQSIDAVLIATVAGAAGILIKQARTMDIKLPVVGVDAMNAKELWDKSAGKAQGTVVPALLSEEKQAEFRQLYESHYPNEKPDFRAALGYDAIKLLTYAIRNADSTVPITLATALRYLPPFEGIIGKYKFDQDGNLRDRKLHFEMLCDGSFQMIKVDVNGKHKIEDCKSPIQSGDVLQDKDRDTVSDKGDICPDNTAEEISEGVYQKGPQKGCPLDSDEDKVPDYLDKCQSTSQLENLKGVDEKGCPVDGDKDGVPDYEDECLDTSLDIEINNQGCPVVEERGTYIFSSNTEQFFSGDTLTEQGKKALERDYKNLFVHLLKEYNINNIEVTGYTDSRGSEEHNLKVSEARAKYVADYLIKEGVDANKITVQGKGKAQPVDTNEIEKGRANNRRIEIKVFVLKKKVVVEDTTPKTAP